MLRRQRRCVEDSPAALHEVQRKQRLLATDEQRRPIPPRLPEGRCPDHAGTGHEADQRRTHIGLSGQRAGRHGCAGRVRRGGSSHQHAGAEHGHVQMAIQHIRRARQGTGQPADIVVAEGDIARAGGLDAEIASGRAQIDRRTQHADPRKAAPQRVPRAIGAGIVDHHQWHAGSGGLEASHSAQHLAATVIGQDDHADGGAHVPSHRRLAGNSIASNARARRRRRTRASGPGAPAGWRRRRPRGA